MVNKLNFSHDEEVAICSDPHSNADVAKANGISTWSIQKMRERTGLQSQYIQPAITKYKPGDKIGAYTLIEITINNGKWRMSHDTCPGGERIDHPAGTLQAKDPRCNKCMINIRHYVGEHINDFILIKHNGNGMWVASHCNGEGVVTCPPTDLCRGKIKYCNLCSPHKYTGVESLIRAKYEQNYADGDLTYEQFIILSQLPCYYCGKVKPSKASSGGVSFSYCGIDRKNNLQGHQFIDCVPCCRVCNRWKSKDTVDEYAKKLSERCGTAVTFPDMNYITIVNNTCFDDVMESIINDSGQNTDIDK